MLKGVVIDVLPEAGLLAPVLNPFPVHEVALTALQLSVDEPPLAIVDGEALNVMIGACALTAERLV